MRARLPCFSLLNFEKIESSAAINADFSRKYLAGCSRPARTAMICWQHVSGQFLRASRPA